MAGSYFATSHKNIAYIPAAIEHSHYYTINNLLPTVMYWSENIGHYWILSQVSTPQPTISDSIACNILTIGYYCQLSVQIDNTFSTLYVYILKYHRLYTNSYRTLPEINISQNLPEIQIILHRFQKYYHLCTNNYWIL